MNGNNYRESEHGLGGGAHGRDEATMPLGVGEFDEDAAVETMATTTTVAPRKFRSGSLVLILVIAMAAVGLYSMRAMTRVSAATRGGGDVETLVESFLKGLSAPTAETKITDLDDLVVRQDEVLQVLSSDYSDRQVALEDVQKNPFIIAGEEPPPLPGGGGVDEDRIRRERRLAIESAAAMLRLKSVIMANEPLANLSGKIVRVGEMVEVESEGIAFQVIAITSETVTLLGRDPNLNLVVESVLRLGEHDPAQRPTKRSNARR